MKIGIVADHAGFEQKQVLLDYLLDKGCDIQDYGAMTYDAADDYPDIVVPLAGAIANKEVDRGIAVCGSGVGVSIAANKIKGIRAALITETYSAKQGVEHDDMNLLCLGGRVVGPMLMRELVDAFLQASYIGTGRFARRLQKLIALENQSMPAHQTTIKEDSMEQYDFGIVGLGVMGRNLLLNMADHGFPVAGFDLSEEQVNALMAEAGEKKGIMGTTLVTQFVSAIKRPRALMLLVPAGKPVDAAIASLLPYLDQGDIIVDGGNTYFTDTDRRVSELATKHIHYFGMGISGGESGARFGPSMMPGGDRQAYERLRPVFEAIAAKVNGEPCVAYMGSGSAGNYVKMVHNGIEYGMMQLIAETYDLLKRGAGLDDDRLQDIFGEWNDTPLSSFLIEITGEILKKVDEDTGNRLVNLISDRARAKGTGKWTSQNAMDLQAPVPSIDMAVMMRDLSTYKTERVEAAKKLSWKAMNNELLPDEEFIEQLKNAYYFAMTTIYAQGLAQLTIASTAYEYGLYLEDVVKIWRGGCIIRAACLEDFRRAYQRNGALPNLLMDEEVGSKLVNTQPDIRFITKKAVDLGIPIPVYMSALAYFDAYRSEILPTNLIQAQRDYFGAHQYERIDREGLFHTPWTEGRR